MVRKGRRFTCGICHREVWVCTRCDRRRKYCSAECRHEARRRSNRRARKRFQEKEAGRLGNARRQREWYQRQKISAEKTENLTHPYSSAPPAPAILPTMNAAATPAATQTTEQPLEPEPEHRAMQRVTLTLTAARQAMATDMDRPALRQLPRCHFCGCPCCEDLTILDLGGS